MDIDLFPTKIRKGIITPSQQQDTETYETLNSLFNNCTLNSWTGESGKSTGELNLTLHEHPSLAWMFDFLHGEVLNFWNDIGYRRNARIFLLNSWANFHTKDDTTIEHSHSDGSYGDNHISGVYYFRKPKNDGHIHFCDPLDYIRRLCPYENMFGVETISEPVVADQYEFILFPSWMRHKVNTYNTNEDRIAISFNYRGFW